VTGVTAALRALIGAFTGTAVFILLLELRALMLDGHMLQGLDSYLVVCLGIAFTFCVFWLPVFLLTLYGLHLSRSRAWARTTRGWCISGFIWGGFSCTLFGLAVTGGNIIEHYFFVPFGAIGGAITALTIFHLYRADARRDRK